MRIRRTQILGSWNTPTIHGGGKRAWGFANPKFNGCVSQNGDPVTAMTNHAVWASKVQSPETQTELFWSLGGVLVVEHGLLMKSIEIPSNSHFLTEHVQARHGRMVDHQKLNSDL